MKLFTSNGEVNYTILHLIMTLFETVCIFAIGFTLGRSYERSIPKETKVIFQEIPKIVNENIDPPIQDVNDLKGEFLMQNYYNDIQETEDPHARFANDKEWYISLIHDVCINYNFYPDLPYLVQAIMEVESNYRPDLVSSQNCVGLMQISTRWQADRMAKLNIDDIYDPYSNILVGVDLLQDLYYNYANQDIWLAIMMYNMDFNSARRIRSSGSLTSYAVKVQSIFDELKGGHNAQAESSSGNNG